MKLPLDEIETRLQKFVESSLYLLPDKRPTRLVRSLVQTLEHTVVQQADGNLVASNVFTIQLHPDDAFPWQADPGLLTALARVLEDAVRDAGLVLPNPISLHLEINPSQTPETFKIKASTRSPNLEATAALPVEDSLAPDLDPRPQSAFLIFQNNQTFPLRLVVINIGRRADNHLVLDDPRVSRLHAQLRAVNGKYILFDLNSTGGTFVNNVRISQQVLKAGDVISLAGYPLIYGEEAASPGTSIEDTRAQSTT